MAECGSSNIRTCFNSFRLEDINCNLCNNNVNDKKNNADQCLTSDKAKFFSSCDKLRDDCVVVDACSSLRESSAENYLCRLDSNLEEQDSYKKKKCMDRYDSSESSDSGILTGSTCSESSSNSGKSDITDPCSPYSVASFHLSDDSGLSPTLLSSKSSPTFANGELLVTKMLPENSPNEGEHDVSWAIEWNDRYELTQDDIDVEVKNDFFGLIHQEDEESKNIDKDDSFDIPPSNRKIDDKIRSSPLANTNDAKNYFYEDVFQSNRIASLKSTTAAVISKSDRTRVNTAKITPKNKFIVKTNYPIDFFNILPSVFKSSVLERLTGNAETENDCCEMDLCPDVNDEDDVEENGPLSSLLSNKTSMIVNDLVRRAKGRNGFCSKNGVVHETSHLEFVNTKNSMTINGRFNGVKTRRSSSALPRCVALAISDRCVEKERQVDQVSTYSESTSIRFPSDKKSAYLSERLCRWSDCVDHISSSTKLIEHLQSKHVNPQTFSETFICLWSGCKVFGRPSCSRTWLERHVLSHGGNKPYKCIVDNCGQRFGSQTLLERHINQHFKTPKDCNDGVPDTVPKLIRRNGQKLRYRRQPFSIRSRTDAFDAGIMSQLQYALVQMAHRSKSVSLNFLDSKNFLNVTFQPKVIGSRQETNGGVKYLIRWYPYNTLEDEWLPKSEIMNTKNVPIWELPSTSQQQFWETVFPHRTTDRRPRKYTANARRI